MTGGGAAANMARGCANLREVPMTTQIRLGDITIHRVVEQELPFVLVRQRAELKHDLVLIRVLPH